MPYCQLTIEEREVISQMHYSGAGPSAIGRRLGVLLRRSVAS